MKRSGLLTLLFLILVSVSVHAQDKKIKAALLPDTVLGSYKAKYKKLEVDQWMEGDGNYKAVFRKGPAKYKATFNSDGKWLSTSTEVDKDKISGGIKKSIKNSEFKDWKIVRCERTETPEIPKQYFVKLKKGKETKTLVFDVTGKMLEQ